MTDEQDGGRFYATLSSPSGLVYRLRYPEGLYLNWDLPLSQQPAATAAIRAALPEAERVQFDSLVAHDWRGLDGYKHLARRLSDTHDLTLSQKRKASLALLSQGVLGITYLGQDAWDGIGVRGHVVFKADLLKIVAKVEA